MDKKDRGLTLTISGNRTERQFMKMGKKVRGLTLTPFLTTDQRGKDRGLTLIQFLKTEHRG